MKRAALYVRVSTKEQREHGLSVDNQITALQDYCNEHGYTVVGIYNDAGISAAKRYTRRPALLKMIDACASGQVDVVLFTKLDRFFRNVPDYYECIARMNEVPWSAIWEDYETETSAGKFKVNIMLSIAQAEAERTSERIKAVNEYRRAQGKYIGKAPIGYKVVNSQLIVDQDKQEAVKAFFDAFAVTGVIASSADAMRQYGVSIRRATARGILLNETYTGNANGYKCDAYITKEQFEKNKILASRRIGTNSRKDRTYLFSGLIRCGVCGGHMDGGSHTSNGKDYLNYRCRNHYDLKTCNCKSFFFEKRLEKYMLNCLEDELHRFTSETSAKKKTRDYSKDRKALESKLERIGQRFEDGDITLEAYRTKRDKIKAEIAAIPLETRSTTSTSLPADWKDVYENLTKENRKNFWNGILKTIYVKKDDANYIVNFDFL